jgi:hypothetical protein
MSDTFDEIEDMVAIENSLMGRAMEIRRQRQKLKIEALKAGERIVTDHALLRYLERHKGIDVTALRDELRALADAAEPAKDMEHHWHPSGVIMVIGEEGQVITVLSPEQAEKWNGRRLFRGNRIGEVEA